VSVRVYSVTGALVRELYDGVAAGDFAVRWDGRDNRGAQVASGTYYAQIRTEAERQTLKLVMLK
jgi:flagellar hook assembly protein FlgD